MLGLCMSVHRCQSTCLVMFACHTLVKDGDGAKSNVSCAKRTRVGDVSTYCWLVGFN